MNYDYYDQIEAVVIDQREIKTGLYFSDDPHYQNILSSFIKKLSIHKRCKKVVNNYRQGCIS